MRSAEMSEIVLSSVRSSKNKLWAAISPARLAVMSPLSVRVHPARSIGSGPGFHSSIHSSLAGAGRRRGGGLGRRGRGGGGGGGGRLGCGGRRAGFVGRGRGRGGECEKD